MSDEPMGPVEERVLVLAPTGRDARLACEVLEKAGLRAESCPHVSALRGAMGHGVGALLIAQEALSPHAQTELSAVLGTQPPWSDLPVVVFAEPVDSAASSARMLQLLGVLGNVTFIERPVRVASLITAIQAALRARRRQYASRRTLQSLEREEEGARRRADFEQQLIGIVSHDLRNPINAITLSAALLLRREGLTGRERSLATRIVSAADRAKRMVRDLLDFTQARFGVGIKLVPMPADFHAVAKEAVDEVVVAYPEREVKLASSGDGQGEWDADRLLQVFTNLVTNAVTYSPPGTEVRVRTWTEDGHVTFEVHNLGEPISPDRVPYIFEPMQRAVTDASQAARSIGLGLYIVDHLVKAHRGKIAVTSTPDEGTTFKVTLPRHGAITSP